MSSSHRCVSVVLEDAVEDSFPIVLVAAVVLPSVGQPGEPHVGVARHLQLCPRFLRLGDEGGEQGWDVDW